MTIYFNTETNEYPRHDGDLRLLGWNDNEPLPENWVEVEYVEPELTEPNEVIVESYPIQKDGKWITAWKTRIQTQEELDKLEAEAREREAKKFDPPFMME